MTNNTNTNFEIGQTVSYTNGSETIYTGVIVALRAGHLVVVDDAAGLALHKAGHAVGSDISESQVVTFELVKEETGRKAAKYRYSVVASNGTILSTRESNRDYAACTIHGSHYFGRRDLVGKGDHGNWIKMAEGWGRTYTTRGWIWEKRNEPDVFALGLARQIAYLKNL